MSLSIKCRENSNYWNVVEGIECGQKYNKNPKKIY